MRAIATVIVCAGVATNAIGAMVGVIDPFVGDRGEGFEGGRPAVTTEPMGVFGGVGTIRDGSGDASPIVSRGWSFSSGGEQSKVTPYDGVYFAGTARGVAEYVFDVDIDRFGGYFAGSVIAQNGSAVFYDVEGSVVGSGDISAPSPGGDSVAEWVWNGWEFQAGVRRVVISSDRSTGSFVMQDDVRISFSDSIVPGPATAAVFAAGGVCAVRSRRRVYSPGM